MPAQYFQDALKSLVYLKANFVLYTSTAKKPKGTIIESYPGSFFTSMEEH
jgi:hypothetical protein